MGKLDKLEFVKKVPVVKAQRGRQGKSPLQKAKERLLSDIDAQISLAKDPNYVIVTERKSRKTKKTVKVERKPRTWVTVEGETAYIVPRFSNKPLNLGGKAGGVVKTTPGKVVETLTLIKDWAASEESDSAIAKALESAKRKTKKG